NVSDIGTCLGLSLGPPASAGVRSKRGALQEALKRRLPAFWRQTQLPPAVRPHASLSASAHCYLLVISPDRPGAAPVATAFSARRSARNICAGPHWRPRAERMPRV